MAAENKPKTLIEPVNYEARAAEQEIVVKKLSAEYEKSPTPDLKARLARETDLLRHYSVAAKGDPRARAKQAAEAAKRATLNKAVQQI